jgi:cytochrome P450
MTDTIAFNPFEPGYVEDPYGQLLALQEHDPVHETPFGAWYVTRYDDVLRLLRDPALRVDDANAKPTPLTAFAEEVLGDERNRDRFQSMLDRDPPDHTRLRHLVSRAFTPRRIAEWRDRVQQLVDEKVDRAAEAGAIELVGDLAFPLPFEVISEMLGLPATDRDQIRDWSGVVVRGLEPVLDPELLRAIEAAGQNLAGLVTEIIEWKRRNPDDGLLTHLIEAEEQGDKLSDEELVAQVLLLFVAGHETTVNLIGNGVLALTRNPGELARLEAEPGLVANAVDELLRYDAPVQMTRRIPVADIEVHGRTIEPGTFVVCALAAANRDPRHFGADAQQLRLDRPDAGEHLSFGGGVHYCLGASLAKMEAQVAIGTLVSRFPGITPAAEPVYNGRINLRGLDRFDLTVR